MLMLTEAVVVAARTTDYICMYVCTRDQTIIAYETSRHFQQ